MKHDRVGLLHPALTTEFELNPAIIIGQSADNFGVISEWFGLSHGTRQHLEIAYFVRSVV